MREILVFTQSLTGASPSFFRFKLQTKVYFAGTDVTNKNLRVYLNGEEVGDFIVSTANFSSMAINGLFFRKGINVLSFYSDQSFIPADVKANSLDTRRLSIAFQNISISQL